MTNAETRTKIRLRCEISSFKLQRLQIQVHDIDQEVDHSDRAPWGNPNQATPFSMGVTGLTPHKIAGYEHKKVEETPRTSWWGRRKLAAATLTVTLQSQRYDTWNDVISGMSAPDLFKH
ncbi:hypothetical protein M413DRAFT_448303 [Hebeloma cylindrosporum]|uniref:Uncharacterized protein n=1 Tax=Hebeloma cylindrosporum TaxID=76867 RepID=A0A0C3C0I9_HEBCY|nr:hypothetical protein M413DRAFT_448303 [Hebeloma cylindrosporum h7]